MTSQPIQLGSKAVKSIDAIANVDNVQIAFLLLLLRQINNGSLTYTMRERPAPKLTKTVTASHQEKVTKALVSILGCSHESVEAVKEHIFMSIGPWTRLLCLPPSSLLP